MIDILSELNKTLQDRKFAAPNTSYVASLYRAGQDAILQKIGEETTEVIIAAKNGDRIQIIKETADLWFHTMVMLANVGLTYDDVLIELYFRSINQHSEKIPRTE